MSLQKYTSLRLKCQALCSSFELECPSAPFADHTLIPEGLSFVVTRSTANLLLKHQDVLCPLANVAGVPKPDVAFSGTEFAVRLHVEIRREFGIRHHVLESGAIAQSAEIKG